MAGTTLKDDHYASKAFRSILRSHHYQVPLDMINPLMGYEKNQVITQMLHLHVIDIINN
jgi:hypothetical protein